MTNSHPNTDQDILDNREPGTNPDLDVGQRANDGDQSHGAAVERDTAAAPGPAGRANQTDTTIGEDYTGGPKTVDPEQQLLNPDHEPEIPGGSRRQEATPGRPDFAEDPGLGGMPNQSGQLDQATYHDQG